MHFVLNFILSNINISMFALFVDNRLVYVLFFLFHLL